MTCFASRLPSEKEYLFMKRIARAACLSCFASVLRLAGNWSGWLVSAKCYTSLDHNRNDERRSWDQNLAIRYCTPDKDARSFAVVPEDGLPVHFDSAANEKAAELPLSLGEHFVYFVNVTSERQLEYNESGLSQVYIETDRARLLCERRFRGLLSHSILLENIPRGDVPEFSIDPERIRMS
jgi:hypothetical protein